MTMIDTKISEELSPCRACVWSAHEAMKLSITMRQTGNVKGWVIYAIKLWTNNTLPETKKSTRTSKQNTCYCIVFQSSIQKNSDAFTAGFEVPGHKKCQRNPTSGGATSSAISFTSWNPTMTTHVTTRTSARRERNAHHVCSSSYHTKKTAHIL